MITYTNYYYLDLDRVSESQMESGYDRNHCALSLIMSYMNTMQYIFSFTLGHCFFQDKILQSFSKNEDIQVTNDGATILKSIGVDNPAAKILVGKKKNL